MLVNVRLFRMCCDGFPHGFGLLGLSFRAVGRGIFVLVRMLHPGLFPRLHRFGHGTLGWVFAVMLFLLKDFLIVGNVAWIGHRSKDRACIGRRPTARERVARRGGDFVGVATSADASFSRIDAGGAEPAEQRG